MAYHIQQHK